LAWAFRCRWFSAGERTHSRKAPRHKLSANGRGTENFDPDQKIARKLRMAARNGDSVIVVCCRFVQCSAPAVRPHSNPRQRRRETRQDLTMSESNLLDSALVRLDEAAKHINVDPDVIEKLKFARETTKVRLMIRMDDGSRKSFLAWRCRYDDTRGPTKGGIRFHPDATAEEVEMLAFWMTFKCAVMNLPMAAGKGGVQVDSRTLSKASWSAFALLHAGVLGTLIGPDADIPAPASTQIA